MLVDGTPVPISEIVLKAVPPGQPGGVESLPPEESLAVRILANYLERGKCQGEELHRRIGNWLNRPERPVAELASWLEESGPEHPFSSRRFENARTEEESRLSNSVRVLRLKAPNGGTPPCPAVLFERGPVPGRETRVAFFNSRKPRAVHPDDPWLRALSELLDHLGQSDAGLVGSFGTLSYDLAACRAINGAFPARFVLPGGLNAVPEWVEAPRNPVLTHQPTFTSCSPRICHCPEATRAVCRDRLVALLSDIHVVLELRRGGNLHRILEARRNSAPSRLFVLASGDSGRAGSAAFDLTGRSPESTVFFLPPGNPPPAIRANSAPSPVLTTHAAGPAPEAFLYHYVRAFPSMPWPGESRMDYLSSLLRGDPESAHRAIDTLCRILAEGRVRGSSRLIPGEHPAVSWTAVPPNELAAIRRWNPALVRWTFEPYGIAVSRRVLKESGARPVIYGTRDAAGRLKPDALYRFQVHDPARSPWKREREWRLRGDVLIEALNPDEAFLFVPTEAEATELAARVSTTFPVRVIPEAQV